MIRRGGDFTKTTPKDGTRGVTASLGMKNDVITTMKLNSFRLNEGILFTGNPGQRQTKTSRQTQIPLIKEKPFGGGKNSKRKLNFFVLQNKVSRGRGGVFLGKDSLMCKTKPAEKQRVKVSGDLGFFRAKKRGLLPKKLGGGKVQPR